MSLDVPDRDDLLAALETYPEYLSLEYPRHRNNPHYQPWLDASAPLPKAGGHFSRAVAKAIYGQAYYGAPRVLHEALVAFAAAVDAVPSHAMVAVIFGMGGGTGSGIVVDLVRHLSNRCFGRRVLIAGIGIAPCDGDASDHRGPGLYPLLNELDIMGDEDKNAGVVQSCGELFRNPFTAGFIIVPQQQVWLATHDLDETHRRGSREIASLLTASGGTHLWELLRLLNWVAAPSTQHSAARTPWGARWIHMFGYADAAGGGVAIGDDLLQRLGLLPGYNPEFVELRVASLADADVAAVTADLQQALRPDVPPTVVEGAPPGSVQFVLPCISKASLQAFTGWRQAYESQAQARKLLDHSLLLEQGILLSAPSTRIAGMAGASLWGGDAWVAVPMAGLLEEARPSGPQLERQAI